MGNNPSRVTAQDKAILDLKTQRDKLRMYQRRITTITSRETDAARELLARGDRRRALLALRRKKYQESLLRKTDGQLEQLERLVAGVEFALVQKDVFFGLQQGSRVLGEIQREMGGIDKVEKLMGDTADAIAYQNEVSEMLGSRITNQDEDEVEEELAALEAEAAAADRQKQQPLPAVPVEPPLPAIPAEPPSSVELEPPETGPEQAEKKEPERQAMLA